MILLHFIVLSHISSFGCDEIFFVFKPKTVTCTGDSMPCKDLESTDLGLYIGFPKKRTENRASFCKISKTIVHQPCSIQSYEGFGGQLYIEVQFQNGNGILQYMLGKKTYGINKSISFDYDTSTYTITFDYSTDAKCDLDSVKNSKISITNPQSGAMLSELDPNDKNSKARFSCNADNGYVEDPSNPMCNDSTKCIITCEYDDKLHTIQLTRDVYDKLQCIEKDCNEFVGLNPNQTNKYHDAGRKQVNSTMKCTCNRGFQYNASEATCRFNVAAKGSDWTDECGSLSCIPLTCNSSDAVDPTSKAYLTSSSNQQVNLNETVECKCKDAYKQRSMNITCSTSNHEDHVAIWKDDSGKENVRCDELKCKLRQCDKPSVISSDVIINDTHPVERDGVVECACDADRFVENKTLVTCKWDGNHTNPPEIDTCGLFCTEHFCLISDEAIRSMNLKVLNMTTNEKIEATTIPLGEHIRLNCSEGYKPVGNVYTRQCILESVKKVAHWSNEFTRCTRVETSAPTTSSTSIKSTGSTTSTSDQITTAEHEAEPEEEKSAFRKFLDNKEIRRAMMIICAVQSVIISVLLHVSGHLLF